MARPSASIATLATPAGGLAIRKAWSAKQRTFVVILDGPAAAIRCVLPNWHPRRPTSHLAQVTPPQPVTSPETAVAWVAQQLPTWAAARPRRESVASAALTIAATRAIAERQLAQTVRAGTLAAYRIQWSRLDQHLSPETPVAAISRDRIQALISDLVRAGFAATTIRAALTALQRALLPAIEDGVVDQRVFRRLALPRAVPRLRPALTVASRDRLLAVAAEAGRDEHLLVALGCFAGLRRAEILALTWVDVDLDHGMLRIRNTATFTTKSGKERSVPVNQRLREILVAHAPGDGRLDRFVVAPERLPGKGLRWAVARPFARLARRAGVTSASPHAMRRAFATLGAQAGISVWKIKTWMGHSSVKTTETYASASDAFDTDIERLT
jgi:integrase